MLVVWGSVVLFVFVGLLLFCFCLLCMISLGLGVGVLCLVWCLFSRLFGPDIFCGCL